MPTDTPVLRLPALAGDVGVWSTGEDFLRVTSFSADADTVVNLGIRFQNHDRQTPQVYGERHVPNTDRTAATSDFPLATGWLQGLTVTAGTGAPLRGQTFVRVDLMRGRGASATILQTLVQGYVSAQNRRAWPPAQLESALEGPGALRSIAGTNPAANTEISETVPTAARWRPLALSFELVTDATAANREVAIVIDDGTTTLFTSPSGFTQTASFTRRYSAAAAGAQTAPAQGTDRQILLPALVLPAGSRIRTVTTNLQAGDDYSAPQLLIEEHLEP